MGRGREQAHLLSVGELPFQFFDQLTRLADRQTLRCVDTEMRVQFTRQLDVRFRCDGVNRSDLSLRRRECPLLGGFAVAETFVFPRREIVSSAPLEAVSEGSCSTSRRHSSNVRRIRSVSVSAWSFMSELSISISR
ncbi:hypothetical protein RSSM_03491 [Rhodopirellula sallentina SM41]|uniref:Uncharacterized protein n=1 Tax=Rhodopirellula sallentina SM41 TaxID=1263870 RepID=M5UGD5_9BACT|nr:hypothetical protein RSSM_03491 [Rhodopirellula sallentina SM41]